MQEDILVPFFLFGSIALIVWIVQLFGAANRRQIQETIRAAVQNGQTLSPETIRALGQKPGGNGDGDLRWGVILIALAIGFALMGFFIQLMVGDQMGGGLLSDGPFLPMLGVAAVPGCVGIGLLLLYAFKPKGTED